MLFIFNDDNTDAITRYGGVGRRTGRSRCGRNTVSDGIGLQAPDTTHTLYDTALASSASGTGTSSLLVSEYRGCFRDVLAGLISLKLENIFS
ncbi:hypothetical protein J6590_004774 [Homalodisca vitripennis]|nr:hypothetical protein J6590_004774 [Homalodisca vitripennis]